MFDWSKFWRVVVIVAIVICCVALAVTYFHENTWWTAFTSVLFFCAGAVAGYCAKGLVDLFKKSKK